jgi:DNA modification methylase
MPLNPIEVSREWHTGAGDGPEGLFCLGDAVENLEALLPEYEGKVKLVYMDPPFMTGDRFFMRVRVGEEQWRKGRGGLVLETFSDKLTRAEYLDLLRQVLTLCHRLLSDTGMVFVHIDYRAHPHVRLLLDEIFGEENLLNEIIWVYQSGGRSVNHFSRKHDVILFYRKTAKYDFNIEAVKSVPAQPKPNHMRRHVDPDGRVYRSIRANGRVYTYYDDEPVAPTDVWQDLSHLQQKDPERTGYDAQKPLALLERIVKCASRPGEWVLDPFSGSCTTLEAAKRNGRHFIGIDRCPLTVNIARRRLEGADYEIKLPKPVDAAPACEASIRAGVGFFHVALEGFDADIPGLPEGSAPMDAVDNWSVGYLRPEGYRVMAEYARSRKEGELRRELAVPVYGGALTLCVGDVTGRSFYYVLEGE